MVDRDCDSCSSHLDGRDRIWPSARHLEARLRRRDGHGSVRARVVCGRTANRNDRSGAHVFVEPGIGTFLVAVPSTVLLVQSQTVRLMPTFLYVIFGAIGVLLTLIGSYVGERLQLGPPPKIVD